MLAPTSFASGRTAFLALDRNGNGLIDDGRELFGDQHGAADGYDELAKFDANRDGAIDKSDSVFSALCLWFGDGRLVPLSGEGIQSIDLGAAAHPGVTSGVDDILRQTQVMLENGGTIDTYALALALARFQAET